jgi:hypothetical protein
MPEALFAIIHKEELVTWTCKKIKQVIKQSGFYNLGVISYTIKTSGLVITNETGSLSDLSSNNNYYYLSQLLLILQTLPKTLSILHKSIQPIRNTKAKAITLILSL